MNIETQEHLPMLRQLLLFRMHELEAEARAAAVDRASSATEVDMAMVIDRKDEADAEQRDALAEQVERRSRGELARCREALKRLDDGIYGDCRDCGMPIPLARLMAQPQAERCAPCQAEIERQAH